MSTPFEIANFNLVNFADNYNDLFDSTPKDVQIDVKDSNGNITTKSVANRGKFKQQLWDDVGGALGQFKKTVYVDAQNGDDNNSGTYGNPFRTIKKAIESVPSGGLGYIRPKRGQTHNIAEKITYRNKSIVIEPSSLDDETLDKPVILFETYENTDNDTTAFYSIVAIHKSTLQLSKVDIATGDKVNDKPFSSTNYTCSAPIVSNGAVYVWLYGCGGNITNDSEASVIEVGNEYNIPSVVVSGSDIDLQDGYLVNNRYNCPVLFNVNSANMLQTNASSIYDVLIRHIVRDADSGNPVNVLSDYNFSS